MRLRIAALRRGLRRRGDLGRGHRQQHHHTALRTGSALEGGSGLPCKNGSLLLRTFTEHFPFVIATGHRRTLTNNEPKSLILGPLREPRSKSVSDGEPLSRAGIA